MTSASNHPTAVPEAARPPVTDVIGGLLSLLSLPSMPHLAGGVGLASRELGGKRKHKGGKLLCVRPRLYGVVPILIVLWDGLPGSCPSRRPPVMAVSPPPTVITGGAGTVDYLGLLRLPPRKAGKRILLMSTCPRSVLAVVAVLGWWPACAFSSHDPPER